MELQINDLVSSIRKEGIDAANAEAEAIISSAKAQAAEIIKNAKNEAEQIKTKNENEINLLIDSAKLSAEHAQRDALLSFREAVKAEFEKLLEADVNKALNDEQLAMLIKAAISDEDVSKYSVEVASVSDALKSQMAAELKNGLTIRPTKGIRYGFRLASNDNSGYFDCSDEEILLMLKPYLGELNI